MTHMHDVMVTKASLQTSYHIAQGAGMILPTLLHKSSCHMALLQNAISPELLVAM